MGFGPQQVGAMSLWQFLAARAGWVRANTSEEDASKDLSAAEFASLGDLIGKFGG